MRKSLLLALLVCVVGFGAKAQNILTEAFSATFPPTGWITSNGGTGATAANWTNNNTGNPTHTPHSGSYDAKFNSYSASTGNYADLITPSLSFSYPSGAVTVSFWLYKSSTYTNADKIDLLVNTSATFTGATNFGTVNLSTSLAPVVSAAGWYQYTFTVPASFNTATNYVIFRGTSAFGDNIYIDDISIDHIANCTGTPTAGTASASPNPVCANNPFTLTASGYTTGTAGLTYRWQSSPAGTGTWTNIAGATTPVYTVSTGITAATDYRFVDTCVPSGNAGVSNTVSVTLNSYLNCYCTPATSLGCGGGDDIHTISLTGFASTGISQTTPCPSASVNGYTNYSSLTPVKMVQGATYSGTISTDYANSEHVKIWIDFNNDGTYAGSEEVFVSSGAIAVYTATSGLSVVIPSGAAVGSHRMRVRLVYNFSATSGAFIDPCAVYGFGEARDYTVTILSAVPPPPVVTSNSPLCPGTTLTITVTDTSGYPAPITYNLSGPFNGSPVNNSTTGVFNITGATTANSGAYIASINSGTNTSNPAQINIVVNPAASLAVSNIVSPTTCQATNGSFTLNGLVANTSYTLKYRTPAGTTTTVTIPATSATSYTVNTNIGAGTYDSIRVQTVGSGGCISNYTIAVVPAPNPPPTPTPTHKTPLCNGDTLKLSVTNPNPASGATYDWTGPNGYVATGLNPIRLNMTTANNGIYKVHVTVNGCVSADGKDSVVVSPPDPAPLGISPTYCQYDVALPLAAQGINLTFYGPCAPYPTPATGPDSCTLVRATTNVPRTDIPGTWVYRVTQNATCPSPQATILVTIKAKPAKPNVPQTILELCQFSPSSPLSASGTNIRWYATPTGGAGTATAPTPTTLVSGTFYYYVSQTINGCESDRAVIEVRVKAKPAPPKVSSPINLCQGDPIAPITAIGQNLLWYTSPSGGVGVPVAPIPNTGYEDSFKYWVSQSINGCESDRALIAVNVNYKPNGVIVGASQSVCRYGYDTFYYYGNARPDAQYVWYAPYPQDSIISGRTTSGPFIVKFNTEGTAVIRLQINNKGCISTLIAAPITVIHLPVIDYSLKQDVCEDELVNISLVATERNITTYHFDFGSVDTTMVYSAPPGGPFGIRYLKAGDYTVAATATQNGCTSLPLEKAVYVHPNPDATISSVRNLEQDVCASDTLVLSVKAVPEGATYTWTPAAYFQSFQDSLNNIVRAVVSQSSYVKVHIKTAFGCLADDSIKVVAKPCCGVYFANAFAPEGNIEVNRTFKPITIGFHQINTFRIVNRWGQTVYETKNERNGWDGMYNGVKQDMGTYFWYISYKCEGKNVEEHGEVTLMR